MKNSFIGSPIERLEDLRFLRGRGEYVDDLAREDVLHAAILRSSVAHGRIRSIDTAPARALPGVHSVITAKDIGNPVPRVPMRLQPLPDFEPFGQPVIAETKVRYVGEPIAVVLADSARHRRGRGRPDRGRHRGAAGGRRPARVGEERVAAVRGARAPIRRSSSTQCAATPRRRSRLRPIRGARASAPSGTWRCRWSRAACSPNGTRRAGGSRVSGAAKVLFFNRRTLAKQLGLAGRPDRDRRERRRRRLRRARRVLSGGFPDPVRGAADRPAGEMDRGPPREPDVR